MVLSQLLAHFYPLSLLFYMKALRKFFWQDGNGLQTAVLDGPQYKSTVELLTLAGHPEPDMVIYEYLKALAAQQRTTSAVSRGQLEVEIAICSTPQASKVEVTAIRAHVRRNRRWRNEAAGIISTGSSLLTNTASAGHGLERQGGSVCGDGAASQARHQDCESESCDGGMRRVSCLSSP